VLGEDELAFLTRRFERLHENLVNMRRNTRTCFHCGKHKSRTDCMYRSRRDHKSKHKNKHKNERRSRKKES
jgi:DNA replication protein DnaC